MRLQTSEMPGRWKENKKKQTQDVKTNTVKVGSAKLTRLLRQAPQSYQ